MHSETTSQSESTTLHHFSEKAEKLSGGTYRLLHPRVLQLVGDVIAFAISLYVFLWIREATEPTFRIFAPAEKFLAAVLCAVFWVVIFWCGGLYKDQYVRSPFEELFAIVRQTFFGTVIAFLGIFFNSTQQYQSNPRFIILLYWLAVIILVVIGRIIVRAIQRQLRIKGIVRIPALVVGTTQRIRTLLQDLQNEPGSGYAIVGAVTITEEYNNIGLLETTVLGTIKQLQNIISKAKPREVLLAMDHSDHDALLKVAAISADEGCLVKIVPDLYEIVSGQARTQQIYGSPLIDISPELMKPWEWFAKRTLDIVCSVLVIVLGAPFWIILGLIVKFTSKGPIFYTQMRCGKGGIHYKMYKFRSMYTDDSRLPSWTTTNDPRVTKVGRFIRKTHLDEIPQAWNVLKGEMSIVGPRPEVPHFVEKWTEILPYYRRRLKVRPGITGWWQVKTQSNDESLEEIENRLRYDFFYIENMSFNLDLEIIARTVIVVLKGHGRA